MKIAVPADKPLVVRLLCQAFAENMSVNCIVKQDKNKLQHIAALMEYAYDVCSTSGAVWLTDNGKGCALVLYPHLKRTTIRSVWLDVKLIAQAIGWKNVWKAMTRENLVKRLQNRERIAYLWFIGVARDHRGQGVGSSLLTEVIAAASRDGLPVYQETSALRNIAWYERSGFEVYGRLELNYTLFCLKREPDK